MRIMFSDHNGVKPETKDKKVRKKPHQIQTKFYTIKQSTNKRVNHKVSQQVFEPNDSDTGNCTLRHTTWGAPES